MNENFQCYLHNPLASREAARDGTEDALSLPRQQLRNNASQIHQLLTLIFTMLWVIVAAIIGLILFKIFDFIKSKANSIRKIKGKSWDNCCLP